MSKRDRFDTAWDALESDPIRRKNLKLRSALMMEITERIRDQGLTQAQAAEGDVVRFAIAKPAGDLNPHVYQGLWGVQDLMFEPLIVYGRDGKLEPGLASAWQLSEDGRVLRLELRKGVTFQDGAPWNAEAMKWNLERWIHLEDHAWINHVRLSDGLNVIDEHTVEMKFKERPLSLLYELTYTRPTRYLSPKSVAADGSYQAPVGTGPWKQISADNAASTFEVFDGYWGEKPKFQKLELKVLPDSRSRMAALRAGDPLGGHLMSGHVDGVATVAALQPDARSLRVDIDVPAPLARYIAPKGSVALDGVSLTVNTVEGSHFSVNLIPHTVAVTCFQQLRPGARLNLEVDQLARYVERGLLHLRP